MKPGQLDVIGTTLHYIPTNRFTDEFKKVQESDEVRAMADYYTKNAKNIVEPNKQDILNAAKNYAVCRQLLIRA
jgi:gamma-glutamyl phosphate reductase